MIYPVPADKIDDEARDELEASATPAEEAGLQTEFGGGLVTDESHANSESLGMMVGFLVLAITLGSLLAAGLPLLTAIIGVGIGLVGLQALTDVIEVSETAPILATMLGLAVGIDYALFILTRYRSNLKDGMEGREAAAHATATAGSAVVFAGATVVIALVGLLVVNIPFLTVMGMAAAGTVSIAVLIALTLLPAIFAFAGDRMMRTNRFVTWRPRRRAEGADTMSVRCAKFVTRRPWAILAVSVGLLGVIAVPATHMELGLPDAGSDPEDTTTRQAYDLLLGALERLGVDLVDVLGAGRAGREPGRLGGDLEPADLRAVAGRLGEPGGDLLAGQRGRGHVVGGERRELGLLGAVGRCVDPRVRRVAVLGDQARRSAALGVFPVSARISEASRQRMMPSLSVVQVGAVGAQERRAGGLLAAEAERAVDQAGHEPLEARPAPPPSACRATAATRSIIDDDTSVLPIRAVSGQPGRRAAEQVADRHGQEVVGVHQPAVRA